MNAELLAMLGGAGGPRPREVEPKVLLSFKAGKMNAERQPDGRYLVTADPRRGTLEMNWTPQPSASSSSTPASSNNSGYLKLEWKDRRTRTVVDSLTLMSEDDCTYSRVETGNDKERVYLLQFGHSERRFFFWMQDKEEGNVDEDYCVKINTFMADHEEAAACANGGEDYVFGSSAASKKQDDASASVATDNATAGGSGGGGRGESASTSTGVSMDMSSLGGGGLDNAALMQIMQGFSSGGDNAGGTSNGNNSSTASRQGQVDSLSNILENLGMLQQQQQQQQQSSVATPAPSSTTNTSAGGLTLTDLQGAMAGLATTSPPTVTSPQPPGPPLNEIATKQAIIESSILENEEIKAKLIELLPENQRSEEKLMENLTSPQVSQCLKSLTAALCDMDGGINSILANFQLSPADGAVAMAAGNPVQAFLDCVLKSVEREQEEKEKSAKDTDGDAEMKD